MNKFRSLAITALYDRLDTAKIDAVSEYRKLLGGNLTSLTLPEVESKTFTDITPTLDTPAGVQHATMNSLIRQRVRLAALEQAVPSIDNKAVPDIPTSAVGSAFEQHFNDLRQAVLAPYETRYKEALAKISASGIETKLDNSGHTQVYVTYSNGATIRLNNWQHDPKIASAVNALTDLKITRETADVQAINDMAHGTGVVNVRLEDNRENLLQRHQNTWSFDVNRAINKKNNYFGEGNALTFHDLQTIRNSWRTADDYIKSALTETRQFALDAQTASTEQLKESLAKAESSRQQQIAQLRASIINTQRMFGSSDQSITRRTGFGD